jgi:hypothetical protein
MIGLFYKEFLDPHIQTIKTSQADNASFHHWVKRPLNHSQRIRLCIACEIVISNIIAKVHSNCERIKLSKQRRKKNIQIDAGYIDHNNKLVWIREIKCNINLDTGKVRDEVRKAKECIIRYNHKYPTYNVNFGILATNYLCLADIPVELQKRYKNITLDGIHELQLQIDPLSPLFTSRQYENWINALSDQPCCMI